MNQRVSPLACQTTASETRANSSTVTATATATPILRFAACERLPSATPRLNVAATE